MEITTLRVAVLLVVLFAIYKKFTSSKIAGVSDGFNSTKDSVLHTLSTGYETVTKPLGKPFKIRYWAQKYVILPPTTKYLSDIRRASREHLSFFDAINDVFFQYRWTGNLFSSDRMVFVVMKEINPELPNFSKPMMEETLYALETNLGEGKELPAIDLFADISLRVFTRILLGSDLHRSDSFLNRFKAWGQGVLFTGFITLKMPFGDTLRHVICWPFGWYQRAVLQARVKKFLGVLVAERLGEEGNGKEKEKGEKRFDAIRSTIKLLDRYPLNPSTKGNPVEAIAHEILQLVAAGVNSPTLSLSDMLFGALQNPDDLAALREEARSAVEKHGWNDGMLNELPIMDSFIREIHRVYPAFALAVPRLVKDKPFVFSDGLEFPPGTRIAFPAEACQKDEAIIGENPRDFDARRFVKLAAAGAREHGVNIWTASHPSASNLAFGYGNHVCPGRFLAIRAIKVIFSRLLLEYEISWTRKPGEEMPLLRLEGMLAPDPKQKVLFRRRTPKL
ncbi:cytochrome P450 [Lentithecium fluviatile CBS 122367]|uniref:Cytochrome P450 n=1 Tax=Lentithecium fluviatile CBS 122367 TaxID=1168545 RepID=A0A6G1JB13_9PLEO|nr:cytochrome P450 [Lentithecium fluviatile CBS 122367]